MSDRTLPKTVTFKKMTIKNGVLQGVVRFSALSRLATLLAYDDGEAQISLQFYMDDQRRHRVEGQVSADMPVFCQRCLQPMMHKAQLSVNAALVFSDEAAEQLPRGIDPVIVAEDEELAVYDLVEDELLLTLPMVSSHLEPCGERKYFTGSVDETERGGKHSSEERRRPFESLAGLVKGQSSE